MRLIYSLCFAVFAVFYLPFFILKGKHKEGMGARFGAVPSETREKLRGKQVLWVHGVSVGEVVQAFRFVDGLRKKFPSMRFVVTTTTPAGREVAMKLKAAEDSVLYFPVDFGFSVRRFLDAVHPSALVLIETEIWPNLLSELSVRGIPAFIVNGRISDRAIAKYKSVRFFLAPFLNLLRAIGVQDDLMRGRFVEIGADPARVSVTGNMKFDWQPNFSGEALVKAVEGRLKKAGDFLLVAGSTHEGEEEMLFEAYLSARSRRGNLRLLIAPRHLQRLDAITRQAEKRSLPLFRISDFQKGLAAPEGAVFLLDSMGALADFYSVADAVFVGGSLVPVGGHNLVEAAFFEKAVLFGPHMQNFSQMAEEFKRNSAGIEVRGARELEERLLELIGDGGKGSLFGRKARELVLRHQGATERNIQVLLNHVRI